MYIAGERRAYILRLLEQHGRIRTAELAKELGVTDETIRTDLVQLQAQGLLKRSHGGAVYTAPTGRGADRMRLECQLASRALTHLKTGARIFLDSSPLSFAMASLMGNFPCSIFTTDPKLALTLSPAALPQRIVLPGGELMKDSRLISAKQAREALRLFKPEVAILCPQGISRNAIGYKDETRARWAAAALSATTANLIIAPSRFLGQQSSHNVPCLPQLLITEDRLPQELRDLRVDTVPYISPSIFDATNDFDY